ncbi:MAG: hypothetical protein PUF29_02115, partial [Anaerobutyricum hallii]|uniref:hypothetical protein n=1 Tax=Anaerobutyricum hallii TaxID=39488 RepID=UPI00242F693F
VKILGKHSALLKMTDDPLAYAREIAKKMTEEKKETITYTIDPNQKVEWSEYSGIRRIGSLYLRIIFDRLQLDQFLVSIGDHHVQKSINVLELLVYNMVFYDDPYDHFKENFGSVRIDDQDVLMLQNMLDPHYGEFINYVKKQALLLAGKHPIKRLFDHFSLTFSMSDIYRLIVQVIVRLLKYDLEDHGYSFKESDLIKTLDHLQVYHRTKQIYQAMYQGNHVLRALEETYHLGLDYEYYLESDLMEKIKRPE